ncbi:2-hydroxyacid dehydrogenase [Algoriphagus aestuariicola]|jgi:D-lactate dehydrogenase|uniref:2-hydroxyacid dehydrogenase n=1 Tax=Algoriphagus aestuariicola TaxID=1852016 RepID=A0ABS3BPP5_9BACT|nr:2-hydroxyacid dehydrogenase [Algoriphagus aestuariicola]MBN7800295.1 2-hydroxyacid dehydrogenase [Algoriphagus aestuariicola]
MKIACFSTKSYDRSSFDRLLPESDHSFSYFEAKLDFHTLSLAEGHQAICSFVNDHIDAAMMKKMAKMGIGLIALRCAGYNQIDLKAAVENGIKIVRVPAYSPEAVAEHAFALILTLARKTHKAYNRVRDNNFSIEGLTGVNIHGKTIGVIGTGAIGRAFCRIAKGFGCKVLAYDVVENEEMKKLGVTYQPIDEVLGNSHIISLHCPLTPETHHLINAETIAQMQDGVALINTSRGALVETKAVIKALKTKKIGFLGIDVYEQEENIFFKNLSEEIMQDEQIARLMTFPNVLVTGHQAFLTKEALAQISATTLANITAFEKGEELLNEVKG